MSTTLSRLRVLVAARARLWVSLAAGLAVSALLARQGSMPAPTRYLLGWDAGVALYLALCLIMILQSDIARIKRRARLEDEGRIAILILSGLGTMASLGAIVAERMADTGEEKTGQIVLSIGTLLLSWAFIHTMFALHYAHEYYTPDDGDAPRELTFPGEKQPDYWDFLYFSFILGTSAQTADVAINGRGLRRVALAHCVLAFLFNTTLLALTINLAAGLVQSK